MAKGRFGTVEQLPSGRWRAKYFHNGRRYSGPTTFLESADAWVWLSEQQVRIVHGKWRSPEHVAAEKLKIAAKVTFAEYAKAWLVSRRTRRGDLSPRTREDYERLLAQHINPALGKLPITSITADDVRRWYDALDPSTPTQRAHCYSLLATIMSSATSDGTISATPCTISGAGSVARAVHDVVPVKVTELNSIVEALPQRLRLLALLACWCALRFGELVELRRGDFDLSDEVIRVRRGVVRTKEGHVVKAPKSEVGSRDVPIPPHLVEGVRQHLQTISDSRDALLFPADHGGHLAPSTWNRWWYRAREAAGRPDLHLHDLRHSGLTWLAQAGATTKELMDVAGHSSSEAALRYQHVADGRRKELAARLSKMADV
ncbi:tyrosine-type recombinase/integrase [Mycobacterium intracellulare]|uniref:Phage integrase family protein n=1 Tax=Mycobacterium intracellulare subsp. chimaera TaxID=222805 RepID=A0A7U5MMI8_MYCIT|nr:site-specific integrase [Mycobacterium intracellulare]ASL16283.1 phage integrase family protein [Mycobacterium intracellulare subsp. chimaera]ASQ87358.1 site-specific integrase [Mycobacterium intracellulare subsp. chimaera]MCF1814930.1 site-specific integrase [Mycobacterium intracellulare subsp. intracellulare]MDM3929579.1 site-specific integrase [Mycobacterium intracellulare subsp. chimaera]MDS0336856.1 site-specific integrase [Mycobacterium intracellulare]